MNARDVPGGDLSLARARLAAVADRVAGSGMPSPSLEGKLLRPLLALAAVPPSRRARLDDRFWSGALAVEMVHEASLLHDDILDAAPTRRGRPTLAAERGVGAALVRGDHLLTAAYRAAAATGSSAFLEDFVEAVERTVAGEVGQAAGAGSRVSPERYAAVIHGKSGRLFGCAAGLGPRLLGTPAAEAAAAGRAFGAFYQRVDDFLDYCPAAARGKPALQDYRARTWTWILERAGLEDFSLQPGEVLDRLFERDGGGGSVMVSALEELEASARALETSHARRVPGDRIVPSLLAGCLEAARSALAAEERARSRAAALAPARALGGPGRWRGFLGRHGVTFRFASRFFTGEARRRVAGVYAFCRLTDDLVDEAAADTPAPALLARLEAWRRAAREAYDGTPTGVAVLDEVMGTMAAGGVSFAYVDALVDGVASDVGSVRLDTMADLDRYAWRVASVVGGWITELFGVRDEEVLARAHAMGRAMQITNVVRDVGEDWRAGRRYLPADLMAEHGLDDEQVAAVSAGGPAGAAYRAVLEALMAEADRGYAHGFEALPALPPSLRRAVAVAARVYRGIHDEVRRGGYSGVQRAWTSPARKLRLGAGALLALAGTRWPPPPGPAASRRTGRPLPTAADA